MSARLWEEAMYRAVRLPLAAVAALFLCGCASAQVEDTKFTKGATSLTAQKSDSARCWQIAQKTNIGDGDASTNMTTGYILFGLVGAMVADAATEEARKDPKNYHRRKVHDECMIQRGYKK